MQIGERIKRARKAKGLTQQELSEITGIGRASIAQYERGIHRPDVENLITLSKALDIPEQDLFDPSKRERIAREELSKHPFKYLSEVEEGALLQNAVVAEVMSLKAAAGEGNHLESIDEYGTGAKAIIDRCFFKVPPKGKVYLMQVDGYSMAPMLYPDSWVIYEEAFEYTTDGLYVIIYNNELMVKLLQYDPATHELEITSKNPDYRSYRVSPHDQSAFKIVGKVLRCVI